MEIPNDKDPNHIGQVNIPVNIVVILVALSSLLTLIYICIGKTYKEALDFLIHAFTTSVIAVSAHYAYRTLRKAEKDKQSEEENRLEERRQAEEDQQKESRQAEKDKKQDKAYRLIGRWNSPEMQSLELGAKQMRNDLRKNPQPMQTYIQEAEENNNQNQEKIYKVTKILNLLVEIAICVENGIADEDVLKSFFQEIVEDYCEKFYDLIHFRSEGKGHPKRYKKLLELRSKWNGSGEKT
ncbi:MAG: DUF4760 domain-containing protein [Okeania sp. SIO3B5]|uniref:DUF4760 domain-containing protein n=1 Tax=Okeania sp. SIO3B5 TaxID=2607811 RepID=UPI0013FF1BC1|nr:DUF4760 domain-containing protein [Okeania sp. SIO3B5]NEO54330.1 DUF4760 domain-containing protein [Okeania sp. SIO3B5]